MAAQNNFINQLLEAAFRQGTYTGGVIRMGLFRGGMPTGGGTEVSGGSYTRQELTFSPATNKVVETSAKAKFSDIPTNITINGYGIYNGTTLIDEGLLATPFTPDITNNELEINYKFELGA